MPSPMKKGLVQGTVIFGTAIWTSLKEKINNKLLGIKKPKEKTWKDTFNRYKGKIIGREEEEKQEEPDPNKPDPNSPEEIKRREERMAEKRRIFEEEERKKQEAYEKQKRE
jgi:hypothetical protein